MTEPAGRALRLPRSPGWLAVLCIAVGLALGSSAWGPRPAAAQDPDYFERAESIPLERAGPQSRWEVSAFFAWMAPVANLTGDPDSFGTTINPNLAFGVDGAYWFSNFGIAAQGFWAGSELNVIATEFQGAIPEELGSANYYAASVSGLYRLGVSGPAAVVQPYFALGAGIRHLDVEAMASPEVEDSTDPVLTGGLGGLVQVSDALALRAEIRDYLSSYESPTTGDSALQNDFLFTVGLTYRIY